jgi:hypothetical protein
MLVAAFIVCFVLSIVITIVVAAWQASLSSVGGGSGHNWDNRGGVFIFCKGEMMRAVV